MDSWLLLTGALPLLALLALALKPAKRPDRQALTDAPDPFSTPQSTESQRHSWEDPRPPAEAFAATLSAMKPFEPVIIQQGETLAVLAIGHRANAHISGVWTTPVRKLPTLIMLRARPTPGEGSLIEMRLDDDLGPHLLLGRATQRYHERYAMAFETIIAAARGPLPASRPCPPGG